MSRVALAALVLAIGGILTGSAAPATHAPQLTCRYGFKYVVKIVHGHRQRVKVCKPKPKTKPQADVEVTMKAIPNQVTVGNHVAYTFVAQNNGPELAGDVTIAADIPPGNADFYGTGGSSEPSDCSLTSVEGGPTHIECHFGELAPESQAADVGQSPYAFIRVVLEPSAAGDFTPTAKVTSSTADPHPENNEVLRPFHVLPGPARADLSLTLSASPDPASVPDGYAETVSVTNTGPTEATDVYVTLLLPQGAQVNELPPADLSTEAIVIGGLCPPYVYSFLSSSVVCFDSVRAGETLARTFHVAPSIHSASELRADAVVSAYTRDLNLANNRSSSTTALAPFTPAPGPDVRLSMLQPDKAVAGDIRVPFRLANLGLGDLDEVTVNASVSPALTGIELDLYSTNASTGCFTSGGDSVDCPLGELPSDSHMVGAIGGTAAAGTYTAALTITSPDLSVPVTKTLTFQVKPSPARR